MTSKLLKKNFFASIIVILLLFSFSVGITGDEISGFDEAECACSDLPLQLTTSDSGKTTRPQTGRGAFQRLYCVYSQGIHYKIRAELRCYFNESDAEDDFGDAIESLRDVIAQEKNMDNVVILKEEINMDYNRAIFVYRIEFDESRSHSGRLIFRYKDTCVIDMDGLSHSEDLIGPLLTLERYYKQLIDSKTAEGKPPEKSQSEEEESYHMFPRLPGPIHPHEKITFSIIDKNGTAIPEDLKHSFSWEIVNNTSISDYMGTNIEIGTMEDGTFTGLNLGTCRLVLKYKGKKIDECEITVQCPEDVPGDLDAILDLYRKSIPRGPILEELEKGKISVPWKWMNPGSATNILSWVYSKYDDFVCGGYQKQVLIFLHNEIQANPEHCTLLNGYDFIPIQGEKGMHHAVVIFPQGTNWQKTGMVLDPWPTQKPVTYSIYNWSIKFPCIGEETFTGDKGYSKKRVGGVVHCPVDLLITDAQGNQMGVQGDGTLKMDIPSGFIVNNPDEEGNHWYFELDPDQSPTYRIQIKGHNEGSFHAVIASTVDDTLKDYGEQPITGGDCAYLTVSGGSGTQLTLSDGTPVEPQISALAGSRMSTLSVIGIVVLVCVFIGIAVIGVMPRIKKKDVQPQFRCPHCGILIPTDSVYCDECGKKILEPIQCPRCGTILPEDSEFCDYCGYKISE